MVPWIAALRHEPRCSFSGEAHFCGATLISKVSFEKAAFIIFQEELVFLHKSFIQCGILAANQKTEFKNTSMKSALI